jgi:polyisoprenoid-binding protein YceI
MERNRNIWVLVGSLIIAVFGWNTIGITKSSFFEDQQMRTEEISRSSETPKSVDEAARGNLAPVRYKLDASQSRFFIDAKATGLLWFLGHPHHVAAKDFEGEVELSPEVLQSASLEMRIHTQSLAETGDWFTEQQRQLITGTIQKEVLETAKYPEAILKSTQVNMKKVSDNQYEAKIEADLTLHGMTRHLVIPAKVTVDGTSLQASGKFEFDRDDYNIKAHSIKGGTIRVDDDMKVSFTIVARKQ